MGESFSVINRVKNQLSQSTLSRSWLFYLFIMAKLKIASRYATVPNELLNDNLISLKSKGMYAFIQSKPDNWEFSAEKISRLLKEGLPSVKSALKELEENGYLVRRRFQNSKGFWDVEYILYENPKVENPIAENLIAGNPTQEIPSIGKPSNINKQEFTNQESISNPIKKKNPWLEQWPEMPSEERLNIFQRWMDYKKEKNQKYTFTGFKQLCKTWEFKTDQELENAINHSISNNYSGIFENNNSNKFNNGNTNNEPKKGTSAARMEAIKNW